MVKIFFLFFKSIINLKFIRPDGRKYIGGWFNGKQHGKGTFIAANGQKKQGEWKNGVRERWIIFNNDPEMDDIENKFMRFTVKNSVKYSDIQGGSRNTVNSTTVTGLDERTD